MWNSALTGVKVHIEPSDPTIIYPLQDHSRNHYASSMLKYYFETWKTIAKGKATPEKTRKKKGIPHSKLDRERKKCSSSWNCVDLNKILFQNEVELISKFWNMWKEAVKNKTLANANIEVKSKCFHTLNQGMSQPLSGMHCTIMKASHGYQNNNTLRKYFHQWKGNVKRLSVTEKRAKVENGENHRVNSERINATSDIMCVLGSNCTCGDHSDIGISPDYLNIRREANSNSSLAIEHDLHKSKIETFLTAIKAAKMKTAEKVKSNHFSHHSLQPKRRKSCNSNATRTNHHSNRVQTCNSVSFMRSQSPLKENVKEQSDVRGHTSSGNISSIKKEVNMSLEEAQSLLESTIAASYKGNCARRKAFKPRNRKGSPLLSEMLAGDILERMKVRELERATRWQQRRERKALRENKRMARLLEEERERLRHQEQSRTQKLQEEKQVAMRKMLEEKSLEEIRKKYHQLNSKALEHYREKLLVKGLESFVSMANIAAENESQARNYYDKMLIQRNFNDWRNVTRCNHEMQTSSAVDFHKKILQRSCIKQLRKLWQEYTSNNQAAADFCELRTQEKAFICWKQYTSQIMIEIILKADMLYMRCLLRKALYCWRRLPSVMECERATARIKNSFRMAVLEIFPDFTPQIEDD